MKEIKINGNKYFYKEICDGRFIYPVKYEFYILTKESKSYIVKKKRFILFGPLVLLEVKEEAVYSFVFATKRMDKFSDFPTDEIKRLEKTFVKNKEIDNSTFISI